MDKFRIRNTQPTRLLHTPLMDMLDGCKDDAARRILLGTTEKFTEDDADE